MPISRSSFFQQRGLAILIAIIFLIPIIALGSVYALRSNRNDVKSWLPEAYEETATFKWYWSRFEGDAFILASWNGCTLGNEKLADIVHALRKQNDADEKAGRPRLFSTITTGEELLNRIINEHGLSDSEALSRLRGSVVGLDGRQTCILLTISPDEILKWEMGDHTGRNKKNAIFHLAVERVYEMGERFGIGRDKLHLGGPPVDNVSIDTEGEKSMVKLAVVCGILGLVMSWWTLRSWRFTVIVSTTATLSAGLSLALVWFSGVPMNAILMTMPALVFVAAASSAIHLSNYYRDAAVGGLLNGAAGRALKHAWLPLALATSTTAIGLASLSVSELTPIKTFGIFSALGVVGSFVLVCTYMPSILELWRPKRQPQRSCRASFNSSLWSTQGKPVGCWILRHHAVVTLACLAVMAIGLYGITRVETSVKLMRLFSPKATILRDYAWLEEHLGPLVPVEIILRIDKDKCRLGLMEQMRLTEQVRGDVEQMPDVGSALAASTFAPPLPDSAGRLRRTMWNNMLERHREALDDYWRRDGDEELWRISARVGALSDLDYGVFVDDVRKVVEPVLQFYADRGVTGISATYTGVIPLVDKAQHSLFNGLLWGFAGDLALICTAIIVLMWNWSAGPLLMLPSIFPLVFVFGAMGLLGIVVDTGTVMAPAVALGVTVDDAIHFMLWCRRGQQQGMNCRDAIMFAYGDCAQPIYQSWAVIGLGLSAFAFSAFMPTRRFGILMLTMLTVSSIGNLVFLPALLAGP
ncbi:MAG: MMPL family transporter, partial [Pirellulales bacterium]|nr:MMPL family transporter [Pirellulales bacterium]